MIIFPTISHPPALGGESVPREEPRGALGATSQQREDVCKCTDIRERRYNPPTTRPEYENESVQIDSKTSASLFRRSATLCGNASVEETRGAQLSVRRVVLHSLRSRGGHGLIDPARPCLCGNIPRFSCSAPTSSCRHPGLEELGITAAF